MDRSPVPRRARPAVLGAFVLVATALVAVSTEPASGQATSLTLAPHYEVQRVDPPDPAPNGRLGWLGIAAAGDVDGDGSEDVLVPQYNGPGRIYVISGATGQLVYTLGFPAGEQAALRGAGNFVYMSSLPDLGSCPHQNAVPRDECPANQVGPRDGVPEILVGASGADIEVDGVVVPDLGRAYVFDGATGALLKRVQMPDPDLRMEAANFPSGKSFSFGRSVTSMDSPFLPGAPEAVRIGDMSGDGFPDFAVGNPTFYEEGPSTNPSCDPGPCAGSGRVYIFRGGDVAGSDPGAILDDPYLVIKNPRAVTGEEHQRFGHAVTPVGDLGRCTAATAPEQGVMCPLGSRSATADGRPDVVISAHRAAVPTDEHSESGAVWLHDGLTGAALRMYPHPEPQAGALFGYTSGVMGGAIGDVGGDARPDIFVPAVGHMVNEAGQGRGYILTGNHLASRTTTILSVVDDPTPSQGGNFGAPYTGIGDVHGDPGNEILIGASGPLWPSGAPTVGDVHVHSSATGDTVLTLSDPDANPGNGFGQGVTSLGDLNGDGWMDFAATAGFQDVGDTLAAGRLYIFRSAAEPPPPPQTEPDAQVVRLFGADRFRTAVAVSQDSFAEGAATAAVVARADDFADALAGGPLAVAVDGPVLLTPSTQLHAATAEELRRVLPAGRIVYILGGPQAIDEATERAIADLGYDTRRVSGPTRIETAIAVARALGDRETLLITTGFNFPDALSAGAAAVEVSGAVLLTTPDQPHPSLDAYLAERPQAQLFAVGGPAARAYPAATAVFGATRDHTAVEAARRFFTEPPPAVGIARNDDFPDALSGSAHIGRLGGPILLTAVAGPHDVTQAFLCDAAPSTQTGYVYGGSAAVSDQALQVVEQRLRGQGC